MFFLMPWKTRTKEAELLPEVSLRLERFLAIHREIPRMSEPDFITLGGFLQQVHRAAEGMTGLIQETIALLGIDHTDPAREGGVLTDLRRLSAAALAELTGNRREIENNLAIIRTIGKRLKGLAGHGETLRKIGIHLGVVGLNIGVESTRTANGRELFGEIAPEVREVADRIHRVAEEIDHDSRHQLREQDEIGRAITADLQALERLTEQAEETVAEALIHVEAATGEALQSLLAAEEHGSAIAAQLGRLIVEMQLHDSMSQRIGHVVSALETMLSDLAEPPGPEGGQTPARLVAAHRLIELQAGQLERIIAETREAEEKSRQAFREINQRLNLLERACGRQPQGPTNAATTDTAAKDPVKPLLIALNHLDELLARGGAMTERLNAGARQTVEISQRLAQRMRHIENIRFEVHLKALNTIVMSARLGDDGLGMEALAQETKRVSDLAHQFVNEAGTIHSEISAAAGNLRLGNPPPGKPALDSAAGPTLPEITAVLERFTARSAEAACSGTAEVGRGLLEADARLDFLARLAGEITVDRQRLKEIGALLSPLVAGLESSPDPDELQRLEQLYTMEKERELHEIHLKGEPTESRAAAKEDDNIELF